MKRRDRIKIVKGGNHRKANNERLLALYNLLNPFKVKSFSIKPNEIKIKPVKPKKERILAKAKNIRMPKPIIKIFNKVVSGWNFLIDKIEHLNKNFIPVVSCVLLIPILGLLIYSLATLGIIGTSFYTYNQDLTVAIRNGNNEFIRKFYSQRPKMNLVASPLAEQLSLYGGTRRKLDDIYSYYKDGYISYGESSKIFDDLSGKIDFLATDDNEIISKTLNNYFQKPVLSQNLNLEQDKNYIIGLCNITTKFNVNLKYHNNIFTAKDTFMTSTTNNLKIVYFPMDKDLGCFLIKRLDTDIALFEDNQEKLISDLILEDDLNFDTLNLDNYKEEYEEINITPIDILTAYTNNQYIDYLVKENKLTYDNHILNSLNIVHFMLDSREGDYKNSESSPSDIDVSGILEIIDSDVNTEVEGEDYVIGEDGRRQEPVGFEDVEEGETINSKKKKDDYDPENTLTEDDFADVSDDEPTEKVTDTFLSDYAFIVKNMKDDRILLLGVKY